MSERSRTNSFPPAWVPAHPDPQVRQHPKREPPHDQRYSAEALIPQQGGERGYLSGERAPRRHPTFGPACPEEGEPPQNQRYSAAALIPQQGGERGYLSGK